MPHISIKCQPKNLTPAQLDAFQQQLTALTMQHLGCEAEHISIDYVAIPASDWQQVWDNDIQAHADRLLKQPGYQM